MTANRRIVLNVLATYGRTLLNVSCGIFSARWVLEALGQTDFGLFGVVGGLVVFIEFLNSQFSGAVSRFYAVSIGERQVAADKTAALENCRAWFSTALSLHVVLPLLLTAIGYPLGIYALERGWVTVPPERLHACLWVWRFACLNTLTAMMAAPFWAMYMARQNIAEMTLFGVAQTIVRTAFIYYMTVAPGDWLVRYAFAICLISSLPRFLYVLGAYIHFEECRIRVAAFFDVRRMRQLCSFVSWETFQSVGNIVRGQGLSIAVNNVLGARVNAAMAIGNQLAGESAALTGALNNAFTPAVVTAYGAHDLNRMNRMAILASKYGTLLMLVFAIPLLFELNGVLTLWLKTPPPHAAELCFILIIVLVFDKLSQGQVMMISASGRIAKHRMLKSLACMGVLPVVLGGFWCGMGVHAVGVTLLLSAGASTFCDVFCARAVMQGGGWRWLKDVVFPVALVAGCVSAVTSISVFCIKPSFVRIIITSLLSVVSFMVSVLIVCLRGDERIFLRQLCARVPFLKRWV